MEHVILVDENDNRIGTEEKLKAHREGKLHRAFSIYIFNSEGKFLLHQRAAKKYHCSSLWSNTCCSHPRPEESMKDAIHRRLQEEMGFDADLEKIRSFIYKVSFENGLTEHEFLHIFTGTWDGTPQPNPDEIDDWKWVDVRELQQDMNQNPDKYTYWFKISMDKVIAHRAEQVSYEV